jgi:hypothetical protein
MKRVFCGLLTIGALALATAPVAGAGPPSNANCFGKGASQLGQAGVMGQHSSSFDEPRLRIGNVAEAVTGTHQPGELGIALGAACG